ncbi:MAG: porin [Betaproteobacteria bacterium]
MTTKLVALAATGALMIPVNAHAQAAEVALYGQINTSLELVNGRQEDGANHNVFRINSNSSRIGIRGTEALGGGLNALFQLESSVAIDAGGSTLGGRDTYVGLAGRLGTIRVGNFLAPYDDIHVIFGNVPTLTTSILSTAALWAQGTSGKVTGGFDARLPNSVRWDTPTVSGLNGSLQYSPLETTNHASILSLGGFYTHGPLQAGVAYEHNNKVRGDNVNDDAFSVAGSYSFGIAEIGAVYERLKYDTPSGSLKRDFWGLSATASVGPGVVYAFYGHAADGKGSAAEGTRITGLAKGSGTSSDQWELSYTYPLSKRTLLYTGYVKIDNRSNASYTFNINPYPTAIGGKPEGWVLGAVHFF